MGCGENSTVFVIGGDPQARHSLVALVSSMGLVLEAFPSREAFLHVVHARRSGCVVADLRLEGIDGIELHRQLVEGGCYLPVILISTRVTVRTVTARMSQGVLHVLEKPYCSDQLPNAIRDAIEHNLAPQRQRHYRLDLKHRLKLLEERERRTLDLVLAGNPNKVIERRLGISSRTVGRVRASILEKTGFLSFVELSAAFGEASAAESPRSKTGAPSNIRV